MSTDSYEQAVDESHRDGHETRWEIHGDTITCSTCGWCYDLGSGGRT